MQTFIERRQKDIEPACPPPCAPGWRLLVRNDTVSMLLLNLYEHASARDRHCQTHQRVCDHVRQAGGRLARRLGLELGAAAAQGGGHDGNGVGLGNHVPQAVRRQDDRRVLPPAVQRVVMP